MTPVHTDPLVTLYLGDCLEVMAGLPDESVDAVVTDPPYGLGFMGKVWDHGVPAEPFWREMYRVTKPGGYLLAFGGTRTIHRIMTNIEDAGWEIRDMLMWIYASGFPKSLDVSKALDKVAGAEREVLDSYSRKGRSAGIMGTETEIVRDITAPATDLARQWDGWGTALKPAHEPIVMARKPLVGTVAANVTRYGTGAINIDGARIGTDSITVNGYRASSGQTWEATTGMLAANVEREPTQHEGRWPSNVLLSDSELFDDPNPEVVGGGVITTDGVAVRRNGGGGDFFGGISPKYKPDDEPWSDAGYGGGGGYSRFFIIPKADRVQRERGLKQHNQVEGGTYEFRQDGSLDGKATAARANIHPTVKPIDLMRHLVRLVTPPGGVVLDPFLGSGTTALAASEEGVRCIGIEREPEYLEIACGRLVATPLGMGL